MHVKLTISVVVSWMQLFHPGRWIKRVSGSSVQYVLLVVGQFQ